MSTAVLRAGGEAKIPDDIRNLLQLKPGDRLEFMILTGGAVFIRPLRYQLSDLKAVLKRPQTRPVSLEEMDAAIAKGAAEGLL